MEKFFEALILTGDIRPHHILIWEAGLSEEDTKKWLLCYLLFGHAGVASWIAGSDNFWGSLHTAGSSNCVRGEIRRHFTPDAWKGCADFYLGRGMEKLLDPLCKEGVSGAHIFSEVSSWPTLGKRAGWDTAHALDRLALAGVIDDLPKDEMPDEVYQSCLTAAGSRPLPPDDSRQAGRLDCAVLLGKWFAHVAGCYRVGDEVRLIARQLRRFRRCPLAADLLSAGKEGLLW